MLLPPMTPQLARRIEQNDIDYSVSRLVGMRQAEGNPLKIEIRQYDNAIAFLIQAWPDFWYGNKVLGIEPSSEKYLDDIVEFFRKHNLRFRFEIMPGNVNSALASRLHKLGFCQMGFNTAVYGQPTLEPAATLREDEGPTAEQVNVREVHSAGIGLLYIKDGVGLLADAATLPGFRGKGCHPALLHDRISHAAKATVTC